MSCDFLTMALPSVQELSPYVPGKPVEELAREFGLDPADIVKLASNENPLGPSPKVCAAITQALPELTRYPDGSGFSLKQKIAERFAVDPAQITLGNGSNDVLELVARAWLAPGRNAVFSEHAFAVYPISTLASGAECRQVPAKDYGHDLDAMAAAIDSNTRVVFIANPNNPTGTWFNQAALNAFLSKVPSDVLVVLDEAYIEYAADSDLPDGMAYLSRYSNLLVSRTFSKAYGLAALRVGYAVSSKEIAAVLNRVRQPFNVNSLALVAACAALDDEDYLTRSRIANTQGMQQLEAGFKQLGLSWLPSRGNFIAVDFKRDAAVIDQALLARGVIVRPIAGYAMPNFLRVSIGTSAENQVFLDALTDVLKQV
ncbi:histidinol-phosphate transaminase [Pseudomonas sp. C27(2019)]|uniref:histidinol-phosphate transaminase n=1 Tax=Pseudomonas sp. C27(2019) TaxID=2604941 RepID=UPI001243FE37|nr:histidinol-phosphate transaminase [Pseudomonas sp. C27(2019)]QEY58684.1 histidinol-phosphate transaminase [Pseudomonas sp. C27(2019)]